VVKAGQVRFDLEGSSRQRGGIRGAGESAGASEEGVGGGAPLQRCCFFTT